MTLGFDLKLARLMIEPFRGLLRLDKIVVETLVIRPFNCDLLSSLHF
jgi:hypothetical protein